MPYRQLHLCRRWHAAIFPIQPSSAPSIKTPETKGLGIVLIAKGIARTIRPTPVGGETIVFEYRPSPISRPNTPLPVHRTGQSNPWTEWRDFGLSCGGAALAWVGVVGGAALSPVTGGASAIASGFLWAGALASSTSCSVSAFRVGDMSFDHSNINRHLDASATYASTMLGLDVIGILGAGGALKEVVQTKKILEASHVPIRNVMSGKLSRPMRKELTEQFTLTGGKRVPAVLISQVVKLRLLNAVAAAVGLTTSSTSGSINDLIVWIVSPQDAW